MQDPWRIWRGFSDLSEVGLICSSAEEEERGCGKFRKLRMASLLKCVVLTSSVVFEQCVARLALVHCMQGRVLEHLSFFLLHSKQDSTGRGRFCGILVIGL